MLDDAEYQAVLAEARADNAASNITESADAPTEDASAEPVEVDAAEATDEPAETEDTADSSDEPEAVDTEDADESSVADEESVDFDDLLHDIPSDEALLREHKRIPDATKTALTDLAAKARESRAIVDNLGGQEGAQAFVPVYEMLAKADAGSDDYQQAIGSMFAQNASATLGMVAEAADALLFNQLDTPDAKVAARLGDAILTDRFGVDAAKIERYAMLEKGGFNVEDELQLWEQEGERSSLFANMQGTVNEQKERIAELQKLVDNPSLIEQKGNLNALKDLDAEIEKRFTEGITPFRERVRWDADSPLTALTTRALMAELKESPEYKEAVAFVNQTGTLKQGEKIPDVINRKLYLLEQKAKSRFSIEAKAINESLRKLSTTSQNAQTAEKVKEIARPKPASVTESPSIFTDLFGPGTAQELAKIRAEARA